MKMPPKAVTITPGELSSNNNASIAKTSEDLQIVTIGQLREIID